MNILLNLDIEEIEFKARYKDYGYYVKNYREKSLISTSDYPIYPIITRNGSVNAKWGMIPFWIKERERALKIRDYSKIARMETLLAKPGYRTAIRRSRCIIPVSNFILPYFNDKKGNLQYYFTHQKIISLAAIYDEWEDLITGKLYRGFTLITTKANKFIRNMSGNDRMPVILNKNEEYPWLNSRDLTEINNMMNPYEFDGLVSKEIDLNIINKKFSIKKERSNYEEKIVNDINNRTITEFKSELRDDMIRQMARFGRGFK